MKPTAIKYHLHSHFVAHWPRPRIRIVVAIAESALKLHAEKTARHRVSVETYPDLSHKAL
jgi:hypothetical protein